MDGLRQSAQNVLHDGWFEQKSPLFETLDISKYEDRSATIESPMIHRDSFLDWSMSKGTYQKDDRGLTANLKLVQVRHGSSLFPLDISRSLFELIYETFDLDPCALHLLRGNWIGLLVLERQKKDGQASAAPITFYQQQSGFRSIWSFDPETGCTRGISIRPRDSDGNAEKTTRSWVHTHVNLVSHPLLIAFVTRATLVVETDEIITAAKRRIIAAEYQTGYHIDLPSESFADDSGKTDLAKLSKTVGTSAQLLQACTLYFSSTTSIRKTLLQGDSPRWIELFPVARRALYAQQCADMVEADDILDRFIKILSDVATNGLERAKTVLNVIFNLVAREDANANMELAKDSRTIALSTQHDSSSMTTIAVMTMLFLPGTFLASLFAIPLLRWDTSPVIQQKFWLYWVFTIPSTLLIFVLWYIITKRKEANQRLENQQQRENVGRVASMITNSLAKLSSYDPGAKSNSYFVNRKPWVHSV